MSPAEQEHDRGEGRQPLPILGKSRQRGQQPSPIPRAVGEGLGGRLRGAAVGGGSSSGVHKYAQRKPLCGRMLSDRGRREILNREQKPEVCTNIRNTVPHFYQPQTHQEHEERILRYIHTLRDKSSFPDEPASLGPPQTK